MYSRQEAHSTGECEFIFIPRKDLEVQDPWFTQNWGLILGGSSGMGLAAAKKLARHGLNILIVHRDRRGAMDRIEEEFAAIRATGVEVITRNADALSQDARARLLDDFTVAIGSGRIRMVLHSIALGNLKPVAPPVEDAATRVDLLADASGMDAGTLEVALKSLLAQGYSEFAPLLESPDDESKTVLDEEDVAQTVYNMGTSLLFWVQDIFSRGLFTADARIIGLTSEGNRIAWRGYAAIAAAKCALESIARSIAREYAVHGLRCNVLQPGVTETPALRLIPGHAQMKFQALRKNPFARLTTPEDVANAVYLLCMQEASWINGALIRVDGGEAISNA